ncbi:putative MFS family arabinose efflux permease [Serratia fonticola]|uniref:Putative MFS family arabinose efflux permease n=1 Tax=Serratia fonticola TaxID=47917 RepID=A0A559T9R0_SERFO|nr:MFS transporter [Serratia fonticola]TQI81126.1 putative MFS family arabinose efflux permease [Serratia fonticola]TQI96851.1 putative MFS family arabinose efflux permease [Serratia fonticola]TVZ71346.1 putative MFS family arabinose efflux permease [Serratia fonticola]
MGEYHSLKSTLVFGAGVSAALHIWKLVPSLPFLQESLSLTMIQAGWLIAVFQLAGMLLGLFSGLMVQRFGLKRSMVTGLSILSAASFAGVFCQQMTTLLLLRIVEGLALLMVTMAAPALMRLVTPKEKIHFFMSLWSAYIPTATVIALFVGAIMLNISGWQTLWLACSVLSLVMAALIQRYMIKVNAESDAGRGSSGSLAENIRQVLRVKACWLLAVVFSMYTSQWVAIISFLPLIYQQAGISGTLMGFCTAVAAGVNIIGNLLAGRLLQRGFSAYRLLFIAFVTMIVTTFVAFTLNAPVSVQFLAISLFSAVGGLAPATLFNLAVKIPLPPQATAPVIGWLQQWISAGQFFGPVLVAWVVDYTHGWHVVGLLTGAWGLLAIVLILLLRRSLPVTLIKSF